MAHQGLNCCNVKFLEKVLIEKSWSAMSLQLWNSIFSYDVDKRISVGVSDAINKKKMIIFCCQADREITRRKTNCTNKRPMKRKKHKQIKSSSFNIVLRTGFSRQTGIFKRYNLKERY